MLMNHIGTHDTERAVTVLAGEPSQGRGREWQSAQTLSSEQRERGVRLMMAASAMQYTLPGVPCVYYGDEAAWRVIRIPSTGAVTPGAGKIRSCLPGTGGWGKSERSIPFQRGKLPPAESQRQPAGLRPGGPGRKKPVGSLRLLLRKKSGDSGPASGISKRDRFAGRLLKRPYPDLTRGKLLSDPGGKGSLRFCGGRRAGHENLCPKSPKSGVTIFNADNFSTNEAINKFCI